MPYTRRVILAFAGVCATAAIMVLAPSALAATTGIWLTPEEIRSLPTSGPAWANVKQTADSDLSQMELLSYRASLHDTATLAVALVSVRLGDPAYRQKAAREIERAIGSENGPQPPGAGNRHNPAGRNITAYVIAADLIDLGGYDAALDNRFRAWIKQMRDVSTGGGEPGFSTIQEERSNNHGTMAGAARAAVSAYLGDTQQLARTAQVLKGWMGDRSSHTWPLSSFHEGAATYMPDPSQPRPVNPVGSVVKGHDMDGAQPQELARCGLFQWPPCHTIYPWGGLAGSVVAAEILRRRGYADVFQWENRAILRAYQWLGKTTGVDRWWWTEAISGDDSWQPWLANFAYATSFPTVTPTRAGRNMGWTDWTHAGRTLSQPGGPQPLGGPDGTAPRLRRLAVTPRRLHAFGRGGSVIAARLGARVSYALSEPATVRFTLRRAALGRRVGGRCVARTRRNRGARRCVRYVRLRGAFAHGGHAGPNRFRFSGRLRGRRLRAGHYRLAAKPTDAAGNRGRAVRTSFTIVRR
jgi:alginate lyase